MNKLKYSEVTDKYYDFDSALRFALEKLNIINYLSYYPDIEQTEIELGELWIRLSKTYVIKRTVMWTQET